MANKPDHGSPITTGVSRAQDPTVASRELHAAIWRPDLDAVLFFCSPRYDLDRLAEGLNTLFEDVRLVESEGIAVVVGPCQPAFRRDNGAD